MQLGQSVGLICQLHAQLVCGGHNEDPAAFYDVRTGYSRLQRSRMLTFRWYENASMLVRGAVYEFFKLNKSSNLKYPQALDGFDLFPRPFPAYLQ